MNTKSIFLSKTFWVQIVTLLSLAVPAVREWLDANPEQFVAVFAAVNVLVRFATSGRINIFGAGETGGGPGGLPLWMLLGTMAVIGGSLPSCSTAEWPLSVGIEGDGYSANYSSKGGLAIRARVTDRRYSSNK